MNPLPFRFDLARHPQKDTIKMMTSLLEKVTKTNDRLHPAASNPGDPAPRNSRGRTLSLSSPYTCFHARSIPSISIHAYLSRILKYCPCANECFLALLVYFDRLSKSTATRQPLRIDSFNIHRLLIAGIMVASKLFSDVFFTNTRYAKVGGLPVSELNVLEVEFLALNNYSLFVTVEELQHYGDQLLLHWMREQEGYIDTRIPQRQLATPGIQAVPIDEHDEENEDYHRVNKAARQLSIDKGDRRSSFHDTTGSKDIHRKSDEIDRDRRFKRPSRSFSSSEDSSRHLPTPPDSSSPNNMITPSPSSSHDSSRSYHRQRQQEQEASYTDTDMRTRHEIYPTVS